MQECSDNVTSGIKQSFEVPNLELPYLPKHDNIYVHGNSDLVQQGADENGKFYKIYYKEEN